jgi:hypothetical protein
MDENLVFPSIETDRLLAARNGMLDPLDEPANELAHTSFQSYKVGARLIEYVVDKTVKAPVVT